MADTAKLSGGFLLSLANKEIDLDSDIIKVMACSSAYVFDQDTHRYKSSVTSEITGIGYTAGGQQLTGVTLTYNATTNQLTFDANDVEWGPEATMQARNFVIYDASPGSDATRPIIGCITYDTDKASTGAPFKIIWDAAGIFRFTV